MPQTRHRTILKRVLCATNQCHWTSAEAIGWIHFLQSCTKDAMASAVAPQPCQQIAGSPTAKKRTNTESCLLTRALHCPLNPSLHTESSGLWRWSSSALSSGSRQAWIICETWGMWRLGEPLFCFDFLVLILGSTYQWGYTLRSHKNHSPRSIRNALV